VLDGGLRVACGEGTALALLRLQRAGKAEMATAELLRGFPLDSGELLP
jgi:methionyl-tRNA formyltransferase